MNFVDYLEKIEKTSYFEKYLLEIAKEENLLTDNDFEKYFSRLSLEAVKDATAVKHGEIVSKMLYYSMYRKFWKSYLAYVQTKAKYLVGLEKTAFHESEE